MAKTPNVALRIEPQLWQAFKVATQERGETMTGKIEEWISAYTGEAIARGPHGGRRPHSAAVPGVPARQLGALRDKAERSKNVRLIMLCDLALDGNEEALVKCAEVIAETKSRGR